MLRRLDDSGHTQAKAEFGQLLTAAPPFERLGNSETCHTAYPVPAFGLRVGYKKVGILSGDAWRADSERAAKPLLAKPPYRAAHTHITAMVDILARICKMALVKTQEPPCSSLTRPTAEARMQKIS